MKSNKLKKSLKLKVKSIFEKELKTKISEKQKIYDIRQWDSLANFNILLSCEREFNIRFAPNEFNKLNSFNQILEKIDRKISKKKIK